MVGFLLGRSAIYANECSRALASSASRRFGQLALVLDDLLVLVEDDGSDDPTHTGYPMLEVRARFDEALPEVVRDA
jgi:hypothetical protein